MIPRTLSASSLQVWELCPDRWVAEYVHRAGRSSNTAADTGTAVHGGLEMFVKAVYIDKTHADLDLKQRKELLLTYYQMSYVQTFNTTDMDTVAFTDGRELTMKWFQRTELSDREVISVENKETIQIPFHHPEGVTHHCDNCAEAGLPEGQCQVPFNYIMDRLDKVGEDEYEVVDYKSVRVPIQPEDLDAKIQARAYALAVQIKFPNAKKIKVTFDLLRYEPVSLWFTRDDNIRFWNFLLAATQRIVNTKEDEVQPTMNPECSWCVKKFTCPLMQSNVAQGGINSLDINSKINLYDQLKMMSKAHTIILNDLEEEIMRFAAQEEMLAWDTEDGVFEVGIGVGKRRKFDPTLAAKIMGPELFAQMGNMTLGNLEKIIKDESIDEEVRSQLSKLIYNENGNLQLKVKRKNKII